MTKRGEPRDLSAVALELPTSFQPVTLGAYRSNVAEDLRKIEDEEYDPADEKYCDLDDSRATATTVSSANTSATSTVTPMQMQKRHFALLQKQLELHQKSLEEQLARQQQQFMEAIAQVHASVRDGKQPMLLQQIVNCPPSVHQSAPEVILQKDPVTCRGMDVPEAQPVEDMSKSESKAVHIETDCSSMNDCPPDSCTNEPLTPVAPKKKQLTRHVSVILKKKQSPDSSLRILQRAMTGHIGSRTNQDPESDLDCVEFEGDQHPVVAFIRGPKFDMIIGVMIIINALTMAVHAEYEGFNTANKLGISPDLTSWYKADIAFGTLQHLFTIFFAVEILLRLAVEGKSYVKVIANWFDIVIVTVSLVDLYVLSAIDVNVVNITFLRLFRLVRLVKIFRIVRVMRLFRHLRLLVVSIGASIGALGWSMVLLGVIQLISSIFMSQVLHGWLRDDQHDLETRNEVYSYFGTFSRSWITMFEITLAPGAWGYIGRVLMYKVNRLYFLFFMFYISVVTFAIVRVITAIFLKETLAAADSDHDMVIHEKMRLAEKYTASLNRLYHELDTDKDGYVSSDELSTLCEDPRAIAWLHSLDLSVQEVNALFELMDTGEGRVSWNAFVDGLTRLKGGAKNIDLEMLSIESKKMLSKIEEVQSNVKIIAGLVGARTR